MANLSNINNKFLVTTGGNVGIGVTGPVVKLELQDTTHTTMKIRSGNNDNILFLQAIQGQDGRIGTETNNNLGFYTNGTDRLTISNTGNVGIGTTSPSQKLDTPNIVIGGSSIAANYRANSTMMDNLGGIARFYSLGPNTSTGGSYQFNSLSSNLTAGAGTVMTILNTGNVGIGTTSPDYKLEVQGVISSADGGLQKATFANVGNDLVLTANADATNVTANILFKSSGSGGASVSEKMRIRSSGTVGIGSDGFDSQMLTIAAGTLDGAIYATSTDANCFASFRDSSSTANIEYGAIGNAHVFRKDASEYMRIDGNGNVGIGTTSPDRTLDVEGTGMAIFGTGDYTELMLRGQVEGTGTVRNVGSWHWSLRPDVGGDNDDLKLLRFVTGSYAGIAMQVQNSTGDIFFGNTVVNPASGFSNQRGFGYDNSTGNVEIAATSGNALTVGRNESSDGAIMTLRKESNVKHSFGSTTSYLLGNVGIGTTSPASVLHIKDNTAGPTQLSIQSNDFTRAEEINFLNPSTSAISGQIKYYTNPTVEYMSFSTSNNSAATERMRITADGKVGIGTTSPGSKLEVKTSGANTTVELDNSDTNYTLIQYNAQGATKGFSGFNAGFMLFGGESGTTTRLQSGGSYAATILENGNFGIGTTSPSYKLEVNGGTALVGGGFYVSSDQSIVTSSTYTFRDGVYINNPNSTSAAVSSNSVMSIGASSGNSVNTSLITTGAVGIGHTTPQFGLTIAQGSGDANRIGWEDGSNFKRASIICSSSSDALQFHTGTSDTERMRITSGGVVGIGDTNPNLASRLVVAAPSGSSNVCDIRTGTTANTNVGAIVFRNSASAYCGQITVNGATAVTNYVSASDYRLKEDLQDFKGLEMVSKISVYNYKIKNTDARNYGVMAHELQEVLPQAVVGEKDAEEMQGVDYSKIVPLLVKSIQELKAEIELLKNK